MRLLSLSLLAGKLCPYSPCMSRVTPSDGKLIPMNNSPVIQHPPRSRYEAGVFVSLLAETLVQSAAQRVSHLQHRSFHRQIPSHAENLRRQAQSLHRQKSHVQIDLRQKQHQKLLRQAVQRRAFEGNGIRPSARVIRTPRILEREIVDWPFYNDACLYIDFKFGHVSWGNLDLVKDI